MNKKTVWGLLFVSLFSVSLVFGAHVVSADSTGGIFFDSGVYLICPVNQTYTCNHIPLYFTFDCVAGGIDYNLTYDLDGQYSGPIPLVMNGSAPNAPAPLLSEAIGSVSLPELSNGEHHLTIYVVANVYHANAGGAFKPKISSDGTVYYSASYADTVNFYIDATAAPNISILSPQNKTYTTGDIPLNFTLNEQATNISYSLDGNNSIAIYGNTTLTGLSSGEHNLTIQAQDAAGNIGTSQTADFFITNQTPTASPTPTSSPLAKPSQTTSITPTIVALAAGSSLAIAVYLKKRAIRKTS